MAETKWPVWGNRPSIRYLLSQFKQKRSSTSYIFVGPNAVGKRTAALFFFRCVLCQHCINTLPCGTCQSCRAWRTGAHPDMHLLTDEVGTIDDVRLLKRHLSLRPAIASFRTALIENADMLTIEAKNGLLKLLEEPPEQTILVLCTTALDHLPLTIRSRCHTIAFHLLAKHEIVDLLRERTDDERLIHEISALAAGRPGLAVQFFEQKENLQQYYDRIHLLLETIERPLGERLATSSARTSLESLLDLFLWIYRDVMLLQTHNADVCLHVRFRERFERLAESHTPGRILKALRRLLRAKELATHNVAPAAVHDFCILGI